MQANTPWYKSRSVEAIVVSPFGFSPAQFQQERANSQAEHTKFMGVYSANWSTVMVMDRGSATIWQNQSGRQRNHTNIGLPTFIMADDSSVVIVAKSVEPQYKWKGGLAINHPSSGHASTHPISIPQRHDHRNITCCWNIGQKVQSNFNRY